ncbi:MAG: hypothetical protein IJD69_01685 [Alphaproteobacteria bacterium]|nr:hypothetical protein [Alphaproteobacteria bacterium]
MPNLNVGLSLAMSMTPSAHALAISACTSKTECVSTLTFGCCCPTGTTGTIYNCPSGWTYNTTTALCQRSSTSASDLTGAYTQSYGTCSYTSTTTYDCYLATTSSTSTSCYCLIGA